MKDDDYKPAKGNDEGALLAEIRRRMQQAIDLEAHNRREAVIDLRFLTGEQWDDRVKRLREVDGRPCLTVNKLPSFLQQVTNDQRQNKPSIKVHPVDDHSDPETAETLQGLIRHIEYNSGADVCYDTAVNHAAAIGFGYFRLVTDYVAPDSFDQEIKFERIVNPFTVYLGPHKAADASDMQWAFISVDMPRDEFKLAYPNANAASDDFVRGRGDHPGWLQPDTVRVVEYYRIECTPATLALLADGSVTWKDEAPEGAEIVRTRPSERKQVRLYKATAVDLLEDTDVPCDWIPVFPVYGAEWNVEGKTIRNGLIRNARDPQYMYNLWMTAATEEVALRTKVPFIGAEGQFEGHEDEWAQANTRNFAYLEYKPTTAGGLLAPPPQRQPMADVPVGALQMAMHAADNIKSVTGIHDASLGARGNETSGKAILARQREGDVANFHFTDNLARTIRHCGRCLLSMIPRVYDTPRVVRILGEDETLKPAAINQPELDEMGEVARVLNNLTAGKYDVTVSMGPSYSTMRQEAADAMVQFGQAWPKLMDIAGDKVVKAMDWPGADEIAERIKRTIPPELTAEQDEQQPQLPPQVVAGLQQMQAYIGELEQQLQAAQSDAEREKIKAAAQIEVARIAAESRADSEEIKGAIALLLEQMQQRAAAAQPVAEQLTQAAEVVDAATPGDKTRAADVDALAQAIDRMALTSQAIAQVLVRVTAPKRLVFDEMGMPIGVEPVAEMAPIHSQELPEMPEGEDEDA